VDKKSRRDFLKAAAAATTLAGCSHYPAIDPALPTISAIQSARKRHGPSKVAIIKSAEYSEHLFDLIKPYLAELTLPDLKNKRVLLKPNMVEFQGDRPIFTNPLVVKAAVELVNYLGAKEITIAEGPGHMRDTEFLLQATGLGAMCKKLGLPFYDLNLDDLVEVQNTDGFSKFTSIWLPKKAVETDAFVSVPKMKMHHWVGITATMKNLLGCIPGRKYGWPKNSVHINGIKETTIDLQHLLKPVFGLVDGIIAMEGDGPINGTAKKAGFLVLGEDLAAVDATCARTMCVDLSDLPYIQLAGKVVGNVETESITILGAPIDSVKQEFAKPITLKDKSLLSQATRAGS
jgi:uncharacterized protein (DUF362 family)